MVLEQLVGHLEKYYVVSLHHYAKINVFKMIFRCTRYLTSLTPKNNAVQTLRESMDVRLPPRHEMRPDSPALHAEQLRFPNQTHKEPQFIIRASRGPIRLNHKREGPSHIHIPKGKLLLRCLWKDGLTFHSKTGNQLSSQTIWGARVFHPVALLKLMFL